MTTLEWITPNIIELVTQIARIEREEINKWGEGTARLILPIPQGAEYGILVEVYERESIQIAARLLSDPEAYFWYEVFEICSQEPIEQLTERFMINLRHIVENRTCIRQKRGWLCWDFSSYYFDRNKWHNISGNSCCQKAFRVPEITDNSKKYYSPAVLNAG